MSNWEAAYIQVNGNNEHSVHVALRSRKGQGLAYLIEDALTADEARALAKQLKKAAKQCESDEAKAWVEGYLVEYINWNGGPL